MRRLPLLLLLLTTCTGTALAEEEYFGLVLAREGRVSATRGMMEFDLKVEDKLCFGDELATGDQSRMQLSFKSSFLSVGPNTSISFKKRDENGLVVTLLELESGTVRSLILDLGKGEGYAIHTAQGTVLVTGTDFVTSCAKDQPMQVSVLKGSVGVLPAAAAGSPASAAPTPVREMQVAAFGAAIPPAAANLPASEAKALQERLPLPGDKPAGQGPDKSLQLPAIDADKLLLQITTAQKVQTVSSPVEVERLVQSIPTAAPYAPGNAASSTTSPRDSTAAQVESRAAGTQAAQRLSPPAFGVPGE